MKLVFFGSPPFATPILRGLFDGPYPPIAVVTQPMRRKGRGRSEATSEVAVLAEERSLPLLMPQTLRDAAVLDELRSFGADVFVVASYGELMREELLAIPRLCCLNVHPSLLPRHRGATPIPAAILAGDETTGVSIQRMVLALDAGDVLVARETPVGPDETAGELSERLAGMSAELVVEAVAALERGDGHFTPQDEAGVTHCKKLSKEDGRIDWSESAVAIDRRVRAMNPWPTARTALPAGGDLQILRSRPHADDGPAGRSPGQLFAHDGRFCVQSGEGVLELVAVKPPGKREMEGAAYLRGARLEDGTQLGVAP